MERRKAVAALMIVAAVAGCITAAAVAAAPSLSLKASDIAKAILPGGFINPKAILPGAITSTHLSEDAVAVNDLKEGVIPSIVAVNESTSVGNSWYEVMNTSKFTPAKTITTVDDNMRLIITYSANCTNWAGYNPGDKVLIKCNVTKVDKSETYKCEPWASYGEIAIADTESANITNSVVFWYDNLPSSGTYYINVSAKTTAGTIDFKQQALTVIAIPV